MPGYLIGNTRVLFLHVPKAGGSSVEAALKAHGPQFLYDQSFHTAPTPFSAASAQHWHLDVINRLFPAGFFDYRFAVVRDPISRLVSEFRFRRGLKAQSRQATRPSVLGSEPDDFETWVEDALFQIQAYPFLYDNHLRPQVDFVDEGVEVFRLEDGLDLATARLSGVLDCKVTLPKRRKLVSRGGDVSVSVRLQDTIKGHYAADYKAFGYS